MRIEQSSSIRDTVIRLGWTMLACGVIAACTNETDKLPVAPGGGGGTSGSGSGSGLNTGVYAIPLGTPSDANQGAFYTAALTTEATSFLLDLDTGSTTAGIAGTTCSTCTGMSPLYTPGATASSTGQEGSAEYADDSTWSGQIYSDTVGLGNGTPNVKLTFVDIAMQNAFFSGNDYQGILGMGPDDLLEIGTTSYVDAIQATGITKALGFELCPSDGTMWLGGVDTTHAVGSALQYTPLVQTGSNAGFYSVNMTAIAFGDTDLGATSQTLADPIVDTGTSLFYIPSAAETNLINAINNDPGFKMLFPEQTLTDPTNSTSGSAGCVQATASTTDPMVDVTLPELNMSFDNGSGGTFTLTSAALDSYLTDAGSGMYCLVVYGGGDNGNAILGDMFLRGFVSEIDLVDNQVGFASSSFCPAPTTTITTTVAAQHRVLERGRGPRNLAHERDRVR
jgi:hypothetical protein